MVTLGEHWGATEIIRVQTMLAWTSVVAVGVVRSSKIRNIFGRKDLLMDKM